MVYVWTMTDAAAVGEGWGPGSGAVAERTGLSVKRCGNWCLDCRVKSL